MGNIDMDTILTTEEIKELKQSVPQLAEEIQNEANQQLRQVEKNQAEEFSRMVQDPRSRAVFMTLTDQVFRLSKDSSILQKFVHILEEHGVPSFFGGRDKVLLAALKFFGPLIPSFISPPIVWTILKVMRYKTRSVIIPGEEAALTHYFQNCKKEEVKININHLGDKVLGEKEAQKHLDDYLSGVRNPNVSCVSVKISTLYSQADRVAREHTVSIVLERLSILVKAGKDEEEKSGLKKLVYLDMEEYKDLRLTIDVFKRFLQDPDLNKYPLGIALQAYIPDSFAYQQELTDLAESRLAKGGAPIRIRIVKGANLEMEKCIASLNGWEQAPFATKLETDANYKRMVAYALQEKNLQAVRIGIGSHNIFEIAFSKTLQSIRGLDTSHVEFEMLEGIANHTRRSIQKLLGSVLIYSPVANREEFLNAIAYLVRRLMENTDKENFLSHSFNLKVGSQAWNEEQKKFLSALDHERHLEPSLPRHKQDRGGSSDLVPEKTGDIENFIPDSPTDFSLPANQVWLEEEIFPHMEKKDQDDVLIPLEIAGQILTEERELLLCRDLSQSGEIVAKFIAANSGDIENSIRFLCEAEETQWDKDEALREKVFEDVAVEISKHRASLIVSTMKNISKGIAELDAEVSEAVDFARYYPRALKYFCDNYSNVNFKKKGLVSVISPWNFSIAIPTGGIVASLATGNRVIIKPSPHSLLATWKVVELFWNAGVPRSALQFIPCKDSDASALTENPKIDQVLFTGSASTADKILMSRPGLDFSGETSGKNILIVTDSADKELAIQHIVESAFGYNGQKCSATSIAILTQEVYDDPKFINQLKDAVESLLVGELSAQPQSKITPLIMTPKRELLQALTVLEVGEEWLVQPKKYPVDDLWSPGVKWNVQPGSFTHLTEFFGPLLGIMKADDLKHACELANQAKYGLTAGIHSLDDAEIKYFLEVLQVGNLYVNNKTTGAIVGRQPFGGIKNSRRGVGGKAGGINYILQFMQVSECEDSVQTKAEIFYSTLSPLIDLWTAKDWTQDKLFSEFALEIKRALRGALSCQDQYLKYFSKEHCLSKAQVVRGQENIFRYRRVGNYTIRIDPKDSMGDVLLRLFAGVTAGNKISISIPEDMAENKMVNFLKSEFLESIRNNFSLDIESDNKLISKILKNSMNRLVYTHPSNVPLDVYKAAIQVNLPIIRKATLAEGRLLMLEQFDEQSITNTFHRYGNLGLKGFDMEHTGKT